MWSKLLGLAANLLSIPMGRAWGCCFTTSSPALGIVFYCVLEDNCLSHRWLSSKMNRLDSPRSLTQRWCQAKQGSYFFFFDKYRMSLYFLKKCIWMYLTHGRYIKVWWILTGMCLWNIIAHSIEFFMLIVTLPGDCADPKLCLLFYI